MFVEECQMGRLLDIFIQLIGPSEEDGINHASALSIPHGIAASLCAHFLLLQKKQSQQKLIPAEEDILRGYAHLPYNIACLTTSAEEEKKAWLDSIRTIFFTPSEIPSDAISSYVRTQPCLGGRINLIYASVQAIKELLQGKTPSELTDIDKLALVWHLFRIGQAQWVELPNQQRLSAFNSMPGLINAIEKIADARDLIRHPDKKTIEEVIAEMTERTDWFDLQAIKKECIDASHLLGIKDLSAYATSTENKPDRNRSEESSRPPKEPLRGIYFKPILECPYLSDIRDQLQNLYDTIRQGHTPNLVHSAYYWLLYLIVTENPLLFDKEYMRPFLNIKFKQSKNEVLHTLLGRALSFNPLLSITFIKHYLQAQLSFGLESDLPSILEDIAHVVTYHHSKTDAINYEPIIALATYLTEQLAQQNFAANAKYGQIWNHLICMPGGDTAWRNKLHLTFLPIILRQYVNHTASKTQQEKLLSFLYHLGQHIPQDISNGRTRMA